MMQLILSLSHRMLVCKPTAVLVVRKIADNSARTVLWGCARDGDNVTRSFFLVLLVGTAEIGG